MSSPPFTPTHVVPTGGLPVWEAPDPNLPPLTNVDQGLEVQVAERLGDWARAVFSNGWSGWLDGSRLVEVSSQAGGVSVEFVQQYLANSGEAPTPAAKPIAFTPALIGGVVVAASAFLPWVKGSGLTANAFKVPVKFLFDQNTQATAGGGLSVGLVLIALGIATVVGAMIPRYALLKRAASGGSLLVVTLFAAQVQRAVTQLSQLGGDKISLFSLLGAGVYGALVGAAASVLLRGKKVVP